MTRRGKQALGLVIVVTVVVLLLVLVVLAERHGAWVWAVPFAVAAVIVAASVRYEGIRRVSISTAAGAVDAVGEWWKGLSSGRRKERTHIPDHVKQQVLERAGRVCEYPGCTRRTRNHFHHLDEDPAHNTVANIIYLCPNHHDDVHRGKVTRQELRSWTRQRSTPKQHASRGRKPKS